MVRRTTCELCALKHLAQARALLLEWRKGYPEHFDYALGHISEAEDELVERQPALAAAIRGHRKRLESNPAYPFPFRELLLTIREQTGYSLTGFLKPASAIGGASMVGRFLSRLVPFFLLVLAASVRPAQAGGLTVSGTPGPAVLVGTNTPGSVPSWSNVTALTAPLASWAGVTNLTAPLARRLQAVERNSLVAWATLQAQESLLRTPLADGYFDFFADQSGVSAALSTNFGFITSGAFWPLVSSGEAIQITAEELGVITGTVDGAFWTNAFTVAFWVRPDAPMEDGLTYILAQPGPDYYVDVSMANRAPFLNVFDGADWHINNSLGITLDVGTWYLVWLRHNGSGTYSFGYNDGAGTEYALGVSIAGSNTRIQLGGRPDNGPNLGVAASFDQITGWSRRLTDEEIEALYNSGSGRTVATDETDLVFLNSGNPGEPTVPEIGWGAVGTPTPSNVAGGVRDGTGSDWTNAVLVASTSSVTRLDFPVAEARMGLWVESTGYELSQAETLSASLAFDETGTGWTPVVFSAQTPIPGTNQYLWWSDVVVAPAAHQSNLLWRIDVIDTNSSGRIRGIIPQAR